MKRLTRTALLAAIAGAALGVRLWGIDFGLPMISSRPDEMTIVRQALRFFGGDYRPSLFNYPSLFPYALHALFLAYVALSVALGLLDLRLGFVIGSFVLIILWNKLSSAF